MNAHYLETLFKIKAHQSSVKTEIFAGLTTFLTVVYIVFVNPNILASAGMDPKAVFVLTCLVSAFACLLMGLCANMPIALAPAMGVNAFFAHSIVQGMGYSWEVGMGTVFWGSLLLLFSSIFYIRQWIIDHIPYCLRLGISSGIGLFIAMMGIKDLKIITSHPVTLLTINDLSSLSVVLGSVGFFIIVILAARNIHAAILIAITVVTGLGLLLDADISFTGVVSMPPSVTTVAGQVDLANSFNLALSGVIFSCFIVTLFDSSGTLLALADKAGLSDKKGEFPEMKRALIVDSFSSTLGGLAGTSSVLTYIESSAGISAGGRTGLTAVVVGLLFLAAIFFSPLISIVPPYATAGALVYVGILMSSCLAKVDWDDLTEATPAFITTIMMPFSFAITEGIAFGFISYCILKMFTGRYREVSVCVWVVGIIFALKIIFIDSHG